MAGLLLAGVLVSACGGGEKTPWTDGLRVVATTVQIEALTKEVAGDRVDLAGIIPAGADSHDFEPKPSDLVAIEDADLILRHGIGLDDWLDDTLRAGSNAAVVTVTDGIMLMEGEAHGNEEEEGTEPEDEEDHADDPHVWHNPDNVKRMVDAIATALHDADPDGAATYDANAASYKRVLDETNSKVQAIIDEIPLENRKLVTNHDAFGYFARAFGLEVVGAVIPNISTGSEPSAQDTAALLETIEREGVKAIFAESSVNAGLARTLADDAGVAIVDDLYGDSLGEPGSSAETLDGMLLANARKIADALR